MEKPFSFAKEKPLGKRKTKDANLFERPENIEIVNNNILIADDVKVSNDMFSKTRGLMFSRKLKKGQALLLVADEENKMETTIHMFFVFFPIDVVWLDSKLKVVDKRENVKSFTPLIVPKQPAKYVLELPIKTGRHIYIGDVLEVNTRKWK
ncbi:MAG TPA: DUF192 domain-containing protein [Candidatus Nanoarchaeia archaeon]|nr:DUF192 domain-containing protein [Candidatus Nanoarchaeia archaeon]